MGAEYILSDPTNKRILDLGVRYCVDEACLPMKVYHGHVASLRGHCDFMVVPRIMRTEEGEAICPKFNGLPEMILHDIPDLPPITMEPLCLNDEKKRKKWFHSLGRKITKDGKLIDQAYMKCIRAHENHKKQQRESDDYPIRVALLGHPYNVYDSFVNMDMISKLNALGIGIITEDQILEEEKIKYTKQLFKKPYWSFGKNLYGACMHLYHKKEVQGAIYLSSFACGIDSVFVDLIKEQLEEIPMMVIKIDEQTGEAGVDTRLEAFSDMLERRKNIEGYFSSFRGHLHCGKNIV